MLKTVQYQGIPDNCGNFATGWQIDNENVLQTWN
jgi:hypothetical protein